MHSTLDQEFFIILKRYFACCQSPPRGSIPSSCVCLKWWLRWKSAPDGDCCRLTLSGHFHSIIITIIICPSSLISSGCGQVSGGKTAMHGLVLIRRTHLEWSVVPVSLILSDIIIESWATKSPSLRVQNELVSVSSTYNIPTVDGHCCSSSYIMHNYRHSLYANK